MITQIGKQLATQIVDTVHDVCGHDINFINKNGIIYPSTNTSRIGSFHETGKKAAVAIANATIIFFIFFSSIFLKIPFTNQSCHQ